MCIAFVDSSKARQRISSKIRKEKSKLGEVIGFYNRLVTEEETVPSVDDVLAAECPLWPWDKGKGLPEVGDYLNVLHGTLKLLIVIGQSWVLPVN